MATRIENGDHREYLGEPMEMDDSSILVHDASDGGNMMVNLVKNAALHRPGA